MIPLGFLGEKNTDFTFSYKFFLTFHLIQINIVDSSLLYDHKGNMPLLSTEIHQLVELNPARPRIPMQHKFLSMVTLTLIAVFAQTSFAADRPALLSAIEVNRYSLERAWYSQIMIDGRLTKIEHTLLDRDLFFIVTNNNDLIALNAETGQTLWSRYIGHSVLKAYAPAANSKTVAVVCGHEIQVFDRRNGRLLWHQVLPSPASAACQLTDFYLYVPMIDDRMACFPMEELKAPSPELLALVKQYKDIGYTLDPYTGKVTKIGNQTVSTQEFVKSQQGEKKPAPSKKLMELVPEYAKIGLVLDPYTGAVREADKATASWWRDNMMETNAPLKGKMELDDLLENELLQWDRSRRQGRTTKTSDESDDANAPYFLKPHKSVPLVCFSFGTTMIQPVISYDSAKLEVLTWFTDKGYLFFAEALHDKELTVEMTGGWMPDDNSYAFVARAKRVVFDAAQGDVFPIYVPYVKGREAPLLAVGDRVGVVYRGRWEVVGSEGGSGMIQGANASTGSSFTLHHRVAVTPVVSYKKESKTGRYEGSIARDIVFQPAIVQKDVEDDQSRFLTVVGSASGLVYAYDSKTKETRWWQSVGSPINNRITAVKNRIYVPCMDGSLWCLEANHGHSLWSSPGIDSFIAASPNWLYVKNTSGDLVRVNPQDGAGTTLFSLKAYKEVYYNNENDRIYLITGSGLIQCLHEMGCEQPVRHSYLSDAYLAYKETDEERRQMTEMPEIANGTRQQPRQTSSEGTSRPATSRTTEDSLFGSEDNAIDTGSMFDTGFPTPVTTPPVVEQPQNPNPVDDDWMDFGGSDF